MTKKIFIVTILSIITLAFFSCETKTEKKDVKQTKEPVKQVSEMQKKVNNYGVYPLKTDLTKLSEKQKQMIPILIQVADLMDEIYWKQTYGNKNEICAKAKDEATKKYLNINYGPWDRLNGDESFIDGYGKKPAGANFYPHDITKTEYEALNIDPLIGQYSIVKRKDDGNLEVIPYHEAFKEQIDKAAELLKKAATLAENTAFKKFLNLRAIALLTDDYLESDLAWMDMKDNVIDFVVGPIENYEDQLFGLRSAQSGQILVKDLEWSKNLAKFVAFAPELQKSLPVADKYKTFVPGTESDINAYDVIYYAGDCNAGGKNIAINLPNDARVHAKKGSRKLQLKNAMRAKFEKILVPISNILIDESQRKYIKFNAFFQNTMFHEVAHGLGVKETIMDKKPVREALAEHYAAIEEGKADIIGLFIVTELAKKGELGEIDLKDNYVTFMTSIFRSVRFGASSAHGVANMIRFYYFQEQGAFVRSSETNTYKIDFEKMKLAMSSLGNIILTLQGNGDYDGVVNLIKDKGNIKAELQKDLDKINNAGIPKDIVFSQGIKTLGL